MSSETKPLDEKKLNQRVVGLKYDGEGSLPQVILKGSGRLAGEILKRQKELQNPPVIKDEKLAKALYQLPIDAEIGPELFELVAILLVHVYAIEEQAANKQQA